MYELLRNSHSHTRWVVLVMAVLAILIPIINHSSGKQSRLPGLLFLIACDLQFLLGCLLYFGDSPYGMKAFAQGMAYVMKTADFRKIAVEHFILMLAAVVLVHIGYNRIKWASESGSIRKNSILFFGIALVLILAGIPWGRL